MPTQHTVYMAGELFSAKDLAGNTALATQVGAVSAGRYRCVLPQDLPQAEASAHIIRDQDITALLGCDAAVFQYDGLELDSGTVVEYLMAKVADVPAVLLRTDFRHSGDSPGGDPWNLMTSFFPRTERIWLNSMGIYHEALKANGGSSEGAAEVLEKRVAEEVCGALDRVLAMPRVLTRELEPAIYEWLALMPGWGNVAEARRELSRIFREKSESRPQ